jgi:DNA-binding IclR family transcriptional regulator
MASRAALAATRSLDILSFLAANPDQVFSLTELARALDVSPSSMFGIVNAMTDAGYLSRHVFQKTYRLGPVAAAVGQAALRQDRLLDLASEEVRRLASELKVETVVVAAVGGDMVTVARSGPAGGRFLSFIGQRVPHAAPVGSIFTAWADKSAVDAWLDRTEPPLDAATRKDYRGVLEAVRREEQAVVTVVDRTWRFGVRSETMKSVKSKLLFALEPGSQLRLYYVGVPVFDANGDVSFGLFANGTSTRSSVERINQLSERLHDVATGISNRVGGRIPTLDVTASPNGKRR